MVRVLFISLAALALSGCAVAGALSPQRQFTTVETYAVQGSTENFENVVRNVGVSLGYDYSGKDEEGALRLMKQPNMATGMLIGKVNIIEMRVSLLPGGDRFKVEYLAQGNFGEGNSETAQERLTELASAINAGL